MKRFKEFVAEAMVPERGTQYGSNEGGIHTDSDTGEKHYVKYYKNPDQGKVEALTAQIYDHMGIKTLKPTTGMVNGREAVSSSWNPDLRQMKPSEFEKLSPEQAGHIGRMYHAAVLTKNWDIVGLEHDNIVQHKKTGELYSVDQGGAMHFRARGGPKPYSDDVAEHGTLRDNHEASGHVFSTVFAQHPHAEQEGLEAVRNMNDEHIHGLFANSGLSNWKELHGAFMKRKANLLKKYGG